MVQEVLFRLTLAVCLFAIGAVAIAVLWFILSI